MSLSFKSPHPRPASARLRAFALGVPGCVAVVLLVSPPAGVPALALAVNPLILLTFAAFAGAAFAPRMGLGSVLLIGQPFSGGRLLCWLMAGLVAGGALGLFDQLSAPLWRGASSPIQTLFEASSATTLILGVTYGALTEELIMRWGLMSLLAVLCSRLIGRGAAIEVAVWAAALLFALGHLPTVFLLDQDPSLGIMLRTGGVNMLAGLIFGYAFARENLESAMLAHTGFHLGVFLAAPLWPLLA